MESSNTFPLELGQSLTWRIVAESGIKYQTAAGINLDLNSNVTGSWSPSCDPIVETPFAQCSRTRAGVEITFTPKEIHHGKHLQLLFYPNVRAVYAKKGQVLVNTVVSVSSIYDCSQCTNTI